MYGYGYKPWKSVHTLRAESKKREDKEEVPEPLALTLPYTQDLNGFFFYCVPCGQ